MYVTKSYKFIWFGDMHCPKPYQVIGSRTTTISHTPVAQPRGGGWMATAPQNLPEALLSNIEKPTLCYAIVLPGRKSA